MKLSYDPDGDNSLSGFDRFGRVVEQVWTDYGEDPDVVLDRYTYAYDRAGNRTSKDNELHAEFDEDYTYDALNRLETMDRADSFDQDWTLDGLGNFAAFNDGGASQTRTTNEANEIENITGGWITPEYDGGGNMTSGPKAGAETTRIHYKYDAWNRLVAVYADDAMNPGEPGATIATYEYDGTNRRIEKTLAATSTDYFYNHQWQLLEERTLTPDPSPLTSVNQYVWSPRYIDAPVVRFHDGNADGDLLDTGVDNVRYYLGDANFNVTATIDAASGDVIERYVYSAYGEATVYDDAWLNPTSPGSDGPLYCGYFFDAETGNDLARNRYYNSSLGTWINRDPIGYDAGDTNLYRYVSSNPIIFTDPSGYGVVIPFAPMVPRLPAAVPPSDNGGGEDDYDPPTCTGGVCTYPQTPPQSLPDKPWERPFWQDPNFHPDPDVQPKPDPVDPSIPQIKAIPKPGEPGWENRYLFLCGLMERERIRREIGAPVDPNEITIWDFLDELSRLGVQTLPRPINRPQRDGPPERQRVPSRLPVRGR